LHLGIVSAVMIYNVGLAAGVTNAMLPMVKHQINANNDQSP
jgi:hypothetical protein